MLRIEITQKCNLKCNHCFISKPKGDMLSLKDLKGMMPWFLEFKELNHNSNVVLTGGEPTLSSELPNVIELLAKNDFDVHLYTNGVSFERNNLSKKDFGLSGRDFSEKVQEKLETILEENIGREDNIRFLKYINRSKYGLWQYMKTSEMSSEDCRTVINAHSTAVNFYNYFKKINHGGNLKRISVGFDNFHEDERDRLGYARTPLLAEGITPFLSEKLKVKIIPSHGLYPAFLGKAKDNHGFALISPKGEDRHGELEKMYKNNWSELNSSDLSYERRNFLYALTMSGLCFRSTVVLPDKSLCGCAFGVLPSVCSFERGVDREALGIERQFKHNGGPLGVARRYGVPEKTIYATLMDKGPCGVCDFAMDVKNGLK